MPDRSSIRHDRGSAPVLELTVADRPAVEYWKARFLAEGPASLQQSWERGVPFRRFISARLAERGLPQELIYLPLLESRYRVGAVSRSGAVGLWQIMANTSGWLGLRTDRWRDERRDFWRSTEAALAKLAENRALFGDWDLALAAYNCGTGKLLRVMRSSGLRDYWQLRSAGKLSPETAEYVPKFYALVALSTDPLRFALPVEWPDSPAWKRVALDRSVELGLLVREARLPRTLMEMANAELQTSLTPPVDGHSGGRQPPYQLKVPAARAQEVRALLADPDHPLLRYTLHTIHTGDTLYAVAHGHGLTVASLLEANPGVDPLRLEIGGTLRVPLRSGAAGPPDGPQRSPAAFTSSYTSSYTVVRGDTLWGISRIFGTTVEALALANRRTLDDLLKPGETLRVPVAVPRGGTSGARGGGQEAGRQ